MLSTTLFMLSVVVFPQTYLLAGKAVWYTGRMLPVVVKKFSQEHKKQVDAETQTLPQGVESRLPRHTKNQTVANTQREGLCSPTEC